MTFTPESIVIIIGALALAAVQIITALRQESKIAAVDAKADVIAGHVNSGSAASAAREESYIREVAALHATIADLKKTAELLAQRRKEP